MWAAIRRKFPRTQGFSPREAKILFSLSMYCAEQLIQAVDSPTVTHDTGRLLLAAHTSTLSGIEVSNREMASCVCSESSLDHGQSVRLCAAKFHNAEDVFVQLMFDAFHHPSVLNIGRDLLLKVPGFLVPMNGFVRHDQLRGCSSGQHVYREYPGS